MKREKEELPKNEEETTSLNDFMVCGDVSPNVLGMTDILMLTIP